MQKNIRIIAIIAVALEAMSMLLLIITTIFQQQLGKMLGYPDVVLGMLPKLPIVQFMYCIASFTVILLLLICCGNKKGGIWLEIIALICLAVVLPTMNQMLGWILNTLIAQQRGTAYMAATSAASLIAGFCMMPGTLGQTLAYVTCGMSIAYKHVHKKTEQSVNE